ncbi:hypothetical protein FQZ97_762130 [compost metagenome]
MVSKPNTSCTNNTTKIMLSLVLELARTRESPKRRLISISRPIRQRMPKKPPETMASSCLFSVLINAW